MNKGAALSEGRRPNQAERAKDAESAFSSEAPVVGEFEAADVDLSNV